MFNSLPSYLSSYFGPAYMPFRMSLKENPNLYCYYRGANPSINAYSRIYFAVFAYIGNLGRPFYTVSLGHTRDRAISPIPRYPHKPTHYYQPLAIIRGIGDLLNVRYRLLDRHSGNLGHILLDRTPPLGHLLLVRTLSKPYLRILVN